MMQEEFFEFAAEFRRLTAALEKYKQNPTEAAAKADAYFHVLKKFSLQEVIAKASTWLEKENKFPSPAQWAGVVVRRAVDVPTMTPAEWSEHYRAEHCGYEDPPCTCPDCLHAGVNERPVRYVPTLDRDERTIEKRSPDGQRTVTAGHWAHGAELSGYYRARGNFWDACYKLGLMGVQTPRPLDGHLDRVLALGKVV
jgi:hypothetical protein